MHGIQLWALGGADRPGAGDGDWAAPSRSQDPTRLPPLEVPLGCFIQWSLLSWGRAGKVGTGTDMSSNGIIYFRPGYSVWHREGVCRIKECHSLIHSFIRQIHADPFTVPGLVFGPETQRCQPKAFGEGFHTRHCLLSGVLKGGQEFAR